MKKILLLLLCTVTVSLMSCKKDTIVQPTSNRTILVDIPAENWQLSTDGLSYSTTISVPENDANFNQYGHVVVQMSFEDADVYEGLPEVFNGVSYTFTSQPGSVTIYQNTPNNTSRPPQPNGLTTAKITLIDSQLID